jgi:hypothetical protein
LIDKKMIPGLPIPPGGNVPDLNLAGSNGFNVASGMQTQPMPDPGKPAPIEYALSGSPDMPIPEDINLETDVWPPLPTNTPGTTRNEPTFISPDMAVPVIATYDRIGPGIDYGDQLEHTTPGSTTDMPLDIMTLDGAMLLMPDPALPALLKPDVPGGIKIMPDLQIDPYAPALLKPQFTQETMMDNRPGELTTNAMQVMMTQPLYQQVAEKNYNTVYQDASGMNSHRSRKNTLLEQGLESFS